nr:FtsQ-type POTRA domain-containing protein [Oceanococcus sp. HetDA_MAG_MS8]
MSGLRAWNQEFPWGLAVLLMLLALLLLGLARLGAQPLQLELYGELERTPASQLHQALLPELQRGFFAARPEEVAAIAQSLPWVATTQQEYLWPNRLALAVEEHEPVANLRSGGVLLRDGSSIAQPAVAGLPMVAAAPQRRDRVAAALRYVRERCAPCEVQAMTLHPGQQLGLTLGWDTATIAVELGRPDWDQALERLVQLALPALQPELDRVAAIDLRHRHAFAVRWRDAEPEEVTL